ncbi:Aldehyde/histidinol dehydrogenase [Mycena latifolia]|nr:Aldehyde/histidinol dehydrogenase [Mycena latifolia]
MVILAQRFDNAPACPATLYTGSARIARIMAGAAAKHLTLLTLELGGKIPVIVDPAYDIEIAARRIMWGAELRPGTHLFPRLGLHVESLLRIEVCVAPDYVVIPRSHQKAFVAALSEAYAELFPTGSIGSDSISRIVSPEHHARLLDMLDRTNGKVVLGGKAEGLKLEITIVEDVGGDDALMEGEIFGPILPIALVSAMRFNFHHPLVLYAFTESPKLKAQLLDGMMSGSLVFNAICIISQVLDELPFGGVGESGYARQTLKHTFDEFSYERASIDLPKEAEPFLAFRYPPYTEAIFAAISGPALLEIPKQV